MSKVTESFNCKAILLGDSGVGKTQMMLAVRNAPETEVLPSAKDLPRSDSTVGVDFVVIMRPVAERCLARILLWDTAGQERFAQMMPSYIRETEIVFLVFDLTSAASFESLGLRWMQLVRNHRAVVGADNLVVFLVGNKADLREQRAVSEERAIEFALKQGLIYVETSCLRRKTVHDLLTDAAVRIFECYARTGVTPARVKPSKNGGGSHHTTVVIDNRQISRGRENGGGSSCCQK